MDKKTKQASQKKSEKPVRSETEKQDPIKLFVGGLTGDTTNSTLA
jgi:hypothetical protein